MEPTATEVHVEKDRARAGSTPHIVRYVLVISLVLAIIALSLIWITGAVSTTNEHDSQAVEAQAAQEAPANPQ